MKLMALLLQEISRESVRGSMEKYFESDSIDLFLQDFQGKLNVFRIFFSGYKKQQKAAPDFQRILDADQEQDWKVLWIEASQHVDTLEEQILNLKNGPESLSRVSPQRVSKSNVSCVTFEAKKSPAPDQCKDCTELMEICSEFESQLDSKQSFIRDLEKKFSELQDSYQISELNFGLAQDKINSFENTVQAQSISENKEKVLMDTIQSLSAQLSEFDQQKVKLEDFYMSGLRTESNLKNSINLELTNLEKRLEETILLKDGQISSLGHRNEELLTDAVYFKKISEYYKQVIDQKINFESGGTRTSPLNQETHYRLSGTYHNDLGDQDLSQFGGNYQRDSQLTQSENKPSFLNSVRSMSWGQPKGLEDTINTKITPELKINGVHMNLYDSGQNVNRFSLRE
jgi:hypothetical protein